MTHAKKLTARADVLSQFADEARERLRKMALDLAEGVLRDDPRRARMRPDELETAAQRILREVAYIKAHEIAANEVRRLVQPSR